MTSQQDQMFSHSVSNPPEGWKKEFDKKFAPTEGSRFDFDNHYPMVKQFISDLLHSQRKDLVDLINGMKREVKDRKAYPTPNGGISNIYREDNDNEAIDRVINLIQEKG